MARWVLSRSVESTVIPGLPRGAYPWAPGFRWPFLLSLFGGVGILGFTLFSLPRTLVSNGHREIRLLFLVAHMLTGSFISVAALLMLALPARVQVCGLLVALGGIADAAISMGSLPLLVGAFIATLGGIVTAQEAPPHPPQWACPRCGLSGPKPGSFCPGCGGPASGEN